MRRRALLVSVLILGAAAPAAAENYRVEDVRIKMQAAGPRGLEALLIRPAGAQAYPLALISHGTSSDATARHDLTPYRFYPQAVAFARRGFAALVVMRRGYGDSGGSYAEGMGCCDTANRLRIGRKAAEDLRAAIAAMEHRPDISTRGMIAVGASTGGFATVTLTADPPPGLAAAINFAGGMRGDRYNNRSAAETASDQAALIDAFRTLGLTSRIPLLWVYAANDSFFDPALAQRMFDGFSEAGGHGQLIKAAAFGDDGHDLFSKGTAVWQIMVDDFLHQQKLGLREPLAAPLPPNLPPPLQFRAKGRAAFSDYIEAGIHKAFAVSPDGRYGYSAGSRLLDDAKQGALAECAKFAPDCVLYAVDDELSGTATTRH